MNTTNITFDSDRVMEICGVPGRLTHRTISPMKSKPGCWFKQRWVSETRKHSHNTVLRVEIEFDDQCGNGRNSFGITAVERDALTQREVAGGCLHDEIAATFPELQPLIKWHLMFTDGPMHYIANTLHHVSEGNLHYARDTAVWPDATDEQLRSPLLKYALQGRLPALIEAFRKDMQAIGFFWSPAEFKPTDESA